MPHRAPARSHQVVQLYGQSAAPARATMPMQRLERHFGAEVGEVPAVAGLCQLASRWRLEHEFLSGVVMDAQVHAEVRLIDIQAIRLVARPAAQQALVDQRLHCVHSRRGLAPGRQLQYRFRGLEREAALEHRALRQGCLLPRHEQFPRPVDRSLQRGLSRPGPARAGKEPKAVAQALDQLGWRHHSHPGGSQLDRERQTIEQPHDFGHCGSVGRHHREVGALGAGAHLEQLDRFMLQAQRLDSEQGFAREVQPLPAGDDERGAGSSVQPLPDRGCRMCNQLLKIIQDHQAAASPSDGVA
jgi:hypothetical protein